MTNQAQKRQISRLKTTGLFVIGSAVIGAGISYSNLYLFHLISGLWVLYFLFLIFQEKEFRSQLWQQLRQQKGALIWKHFLLWLLLWFAISTLWAEGKMHAFQYLYYLLVGNFLYYLFYTFSDAEDHKRILSALAIPFFLEGFIVLLEIFTSFKWFISPASPYLSWCGREVFQPESLHPADLHNIMTFPNGFHWNPNNLAVFFLMAFPFLLFNKNKLIAITGSALCILTIIACGSRISFIALVFILLLSIFFIKQTRALPQLSSWLVILLMVSNFFSFRAAEHSGIREIQSLFNSELSLSSTDDAKAMNANSDRIRMTLMQNGWQWFTESYGIGIGAGNDRYKFEALGGIGKKKVSTMHNFWLEQTVNGGLIALLLWALWYLNTLKALWEKMRKKDKEQYYYTAIFLSMCGFFVGVVSLSSAIYFLPFYLMIAWTNQLISAR